MDIARYNVEKKLIGTSNELFVRPSSFKGFAIYERLGDNRAQEIVGGMDEKEANDFLRDVKKLKFEMHEEAVRRLNLFKVMDEVISAFNKGTVMVSENMGGPFRAILYNAENYEGLLPKIRDFQEEYGALVYHVQLTHTTIGDMYAMLYVSSHKDEWDMDTDFEGDDAYVYANVWNGDIEEQGGITVRPNQGGIERIG